MEKQIDDIFRRCYGKLTAALYGRLNNFDLVEEAIQEAFLIAWQKWPVEGIPDNAEGWLFTVAKRRAVDVVRRESSADEKYARLVTNPDFVTFAQSAEDETLDGGPMDQRLELIFTCCHPVLATEVQIALTLHTVCGLTTKEIASAFLVGETTLAQRLVRAKRKIREAGVPFKIPENRRLAERLDAVLHVIYLIFNEGYSATSGRGSIRGDLCDEALFLSTILTELVPNSADVYALNALLFLQDSRRAARINSDGQPILLPDQDRSLWAADKIAHGLQAFATADQLGGGGPFFYQAGIAAEHSAAKTAEATNWPAIVTWYDGLVAAGGGPVAELNRAVAVGYARGPAQALALLDNPDLAAQLAGYRWYYTTRAEFLFRLERLSESLTAFRKALEMCTNETERAHITRRMKEIDPVRSV